MSKPAYQIIKRPIITEKGARLRETGGMPAGKATEETLERKVLFEVSRDANKIEIRRAIEALFDVKVIDVHTQIVRGKEKRVGKFTGRKPNWKKAVITLAKGNKIEFFEGV